MTVRYKLQLGVIPTDGSERKVVAVLKTDESGQQWSIPLVDENRMYQEYKSWLDEGNTPEPADPIPEPTPLTPQEKLANAGLTVDELKQLLGLS